MVGSWISPRLQAGVESGEQDSFVELGRLHEKGNVDHVALGERSVVVVELPEHTRRLEQGRLHVGDRLEGQDVTGFEPDGEKACWECIRAMQGFLKRGKSVPGL